MDDETPPGLLRPFDPREAISIKQAAGQAGKSEGTIRLWCERHQIGRRVPDGGPFHVSRIALAMLLDGDRAALALYLAGDRTERVARYFARYSIPLPKEAAHV